MKKYIPLLLCLCGCASAEPDSLPPVIDNSSYPTSAPPANVAPAPSSNAVYELLGRLDKMQAEMQQLTGKVEEQGNQIAELKKQQATMYSDLDERLRGSQASAPAAATPTEPPAASSAPETTIADVPAPPAVPAEPEAAVANAPAPAPAPTPAPAPKVEVKASGDEKQAYQKAYTSLRNGKTDQSIEQFKAYLSQYPTGGYADVTYYWLGEAYRVKPDVDSARQAYNTVLEKYPNSTKVAEALLKLGIIEADQKNADKAREYLTRVTAEFPNTPAAHSAEKKLMQLK
ncbi:MAG: tol-pal system protein YbgF [Methylococcaceae bacterium]|nr:tol-pal system protein YbgF [Methylococcaceae bacterium]